MKGNLSESFGKHLIVLRNEKGFTQKQLAQKLQVSESTYANWEQGRREPNLFHLMEIARILEIDMNTLFEIDY